ncbi:MAG: sigma-70 family RNA polymerase sigma factor, partial [Chloroflexi bacterium]
MMAVALNDPQQCLDETFEYIVDKYRTEVYRLCLYHLHDEHEAEDATQETFLRVYRSLHRYDPARSFKTWLMTIATNYCTDCLRRQYRHNHIAQVPVSPTLAADDPDPETHVLRQDNRRAV